jgi:hypothetical protein
VAFATGRSRVRPIPCRPGELFAGAFHPGPPPHGKAPPWSSNAGTAVFPDPGPLQFRDATRSIPPSWDERNGEHRPRSHARLRENREDRLTETIICVRRDLPARPPKQKRSSRRSSRTSDDRCAYSARPRPNLIERDGGPHRQRSPLTRSHHPQPPWRAARWPCGPDSRRRGKSRSGRPRPPCAAALRPG